MPDRHYNSDEGEFVDFETLEDWETRDKAKDRQIAALAAERDAALARAELAEAALASLQGGDWGDEADHATPLIRADFRSDGYYPRFQLAQSLIDNRRSKGALVALVCYLLRDDALAALNGGTDD
jgi:hypothetical protein